MKLKPSHKAAAVIVLGAVSIGTAVYFATRKRSAYEPPLPPPSTDQTTPLSEYDKVTSIVPRYDGSNLLFISKVKHNREKFATRVLSLSADLSIDPNHLMAVMYIESRLDSAAVNKQPASIPGYDGNGKLVKPAGTPDSSNDSTRSQYRATGLIQFMPKTAASLGTSTQDLYNMTNLQQLVYVKRYLTPYASKVRTFEDLYLTVFFPAAVGKPNDFILQANPRPTASSVARQNPKYDRNKDMKVRKHEVIEALNDIFRPLLNA